MQGALEEPRFTRERIAFVGPERLPAPPGPAGQGRFEGRNISSRVVAHDRISPLVEVSIVEIGCAVNHGGFHVELRAAAGRIDDGGIGARGSQSRGCHDVCSAKPSVHVAEGASLEPHGHPAAATGRALESREHTARMKEVRYQRDPAGGRYGV